MMTDEEAIYHVWKLANQAKGEYGGWWNSFNEAQNAYLAVLRQIQNRGGLPIFGGGKPHLPETFAQYLGKGYAISRLEEVFTSGKSHLDGSAKRDFDTLLVKVRDLVAYSRHLLGEDGESTQPLRSDPRGTTTADAVDGMSPSPAPMPVAEGLRSSSGGERGKSFQARAEQIRGSVQRLRTSASTVGEQSGQLGSLSRQMLDVGQTLAALSQVLGDASGKLSADTESMNRISNDMLEDYREDRKHLDRTLHERSESGKRTIEKIIGMIDDLAAQYHYEDPDLVSVYAEGGRNSSKHRAVYEENERGTSGAHAPAGSGEAARFDMLLLRNVLDRLWGFLAEEYEVILIPVKSGDLYNDEFMAGKNALPTEHQGQHNHVARVIRFGYQHADGRLYRTASVDIYRAR